MHHNLMQTRRELGGSQAVLSVLVPSSAALKYPAAPHIAHPRASQSNRDFYKARLYAGLMFRRLCWIQSVQMLIYISW